MSWRSHVFTCTITNKIVPDANSLSIEELPEVGIPDENGTAVVLKFSELDEFQNYVKIKLWHIV